MKTLLDKAKDLRPKNKVKQDVTEEEYQLAIAWVKGEISLRQIKEVMGYDNVNSSYVFLSHCFKYSISKTQ